MKEGTTEALETKAPTMYQEVEQDEDVARGHIKVIEIIAYEKVGETQNDVGKKTDVMEGRGMYFCQFPEDVQKFESNHPKLKIEQFTVQVQKKTAINYINNPKNIEAFKEKK